MLEYLFYVIGEYVCEINAVSSSGHGVVFSTSTELTVEAPTLKDLVAYTKQKCGTPVVFTAGLTRATNLSGGKVVIFDKVFSNLGGAYNPNTGNFVCPYAGT